MNDQPCKIKLPDPPPHLNSWPWKNECQNIDSCKNLSYCPLVSIITPSFNQCEFIEETIRSVLLQNYPNIEYIIIDGGSSDNSVDIIRKYEPWLTYWVSEADLGQADAINKGIKKTSGEIIAYINSDDIYYPGSISKAVNRLLQTSSDIVLGAIEHVEIDGGNKNYKRIETTNEGRDARIHQFPIFRNGRIEDIHFIQPGMFWRKEIFKLTGNFNTYYSYIFDREWFTRALSRGAVISVSDDVFARFAWHNRSKSGTQLKMFTLERIEMYKNFSKDKEHFRPIPCFLEAFFWWINYHLNEKFTRFRECKINKKWIRSIWIYTQFFTLLLIKKTLQLFSQR